MSKLLRKVTRQIRHSVLSLCARLLIAAMRLLPMRAARAIGGLLSWCTHAMATRSRHMARTHLARAFPDAPPREIAALARGVFASCGHIVMELAKASQLSDERLRAIVGFADADLWTRTKGSGGLIIIGLHLGNWELLARYLTRCMGERVLVIAREQSNSGLEALIDSIRRDNGLEIAHRGGNLRPLVRALRAGAVLGVLADQSIAGATVEVPFFGHLAPAHEGPAQIARLARAPFLVMAMVRRRACAGEAHWGGYRFDFLALPPSSNVTERAEDSESMAITSDYSASVEQLIRRHPDQWMWYHDRWRKQAGQRQRVRGREWRELREHRKQEKRHAARSGVEPPPPDPRLRRTRRED